MWFMFQYCLEEGIPTYLEILQVLGRGTFEWDEKLLALLL